MTDYSFKQEEIGFVLNEPEADEGFLTPQPKERFIRMPEVRRRTGFARSTIYLHISLGIFPKNRKLGTRSVGWVESEIDAWIKTRMEQGQ